MGRSSLLVFVALLSLASSARSGSSSAAPPSNAAAMLTRAASVADHMISCSFASNTGTFPSEDLWQSGNTLETFSNLLLLLSPSSSPLPPSSLSPSLLAWANTTLAPLLQDIYLRTPPVVDNCNDDHGWWTLAWIRAYQAANAWAGTDPLSPSNPFFPFLQRASQSFGYVAEVGWSTLPCGGGVQWCPNAAVPYKNAVTSELFLTAAIELHMYAPALLPSPQTFYLDWAQTAWDWLGNSGMMNSDNLFNDGLSAAAANSTVCPNNNGTTWTYNQGVLLDGLGLLSFAQGGNASALATAKAVARAAMTILVSPEGILTEPCGKSCDGDQQIFKGVFVRHLAKLVDALAENGSPDPAFTQEVAQFLSANAASVQANAVCTLPEGLYGVLWQGPCGAIFGGSTASTSAALDLFLASVEVPGAAPPPPYSGWVPFGLGNCADTNGNSMPNCYNNRNITEEECAQQASADAQAQGYDFEVNCDGSTFCRVRSLGASPTSCPSGWGFSPGSATSVNATTYASSTLCMVRSQ